jgi:hypothetical protein
MISRRTSLLLIIAIALGCSPNATGLPGGGPTVDGIRAIHITRNGAVLPSVVRLGALGSQRLDVVLEDAEGNLTPRVSQLVSWGSTNPGVADAAEELRGVIYVNRNGEAKIIAHLDGFRDTVTFQIAQVAVAGRVEADTLVTLTPDARNLNGAANGYHAFRYGAARVDSSGYVVSSQIPLRFDAGVDPLFEVQLEPRGDTIAVRGLRKGTSTLTTIFGDMTDIVPVQVTDAYRVVRLIETGSGALRTLPDTVRIPAGAAVIFQNETRSLLMIDSYGPQRVEWRVGPLRPNGLQAQLFSEPGNHTYSWNGGEGVVIVTP